MKLRIILSETDIHVITIEAAPDSLDTFKEYLCDKLQLQSRQISIGGLQYRDPDFDDYVNLENVRELKDLMSLKVIPRRNDDQPSNENEPVPSSSGSDGRPDNLRKARWPKEGFTVAMIPKFDHEVEVALVVANKQFAEEGSVTFLRKGHRTKILDRLAEQITTLAGIYPDKNQLQQVAASLVGKHPGISDKVSKAGCQMWLNSLTFKMGAYRGVLRQLGSQEATVNGNRRGVANKRNLECLPPAKAIKKPRRGEVNWQPDLPDGEDEKTMEQHRTAIKSELVKVKPDNVKVAKLMALTYSYRRTDINSNLPVATIRHKWPALFKRSQV